MRYLLLPLVLAACGTSRLTDATGQTPDSSASFIRSSSAAPTHRVVGHGIQRIGPGFEYGITVDVRSDAHGRVSGYLNTNIIDLSSYGYPGTPEIDAEPTCMRVVGNTAYINAVVTRSTDPLFAPIGSRSIFWVRDGGPGMHDVGHAGPGELLDPENLICTTTPPAVSSDPVNSGDFTVR